MWITIAAYALTLMAVFFAINSLFLSFVGGILVRFITKNHMMGNLLAAFILWNIISFIWVSFEGGVPPVLVLVSAIGILFMSDNDELTDIASLMIAAEQLAIIILGGILMYNSESIRWF